MARRTFDVIDVVEILIHWYAGRSKNEMAASLGVDRKTLRKYIAPAEAAGIVPGGPPMGEADWRSWCRAGSRSWRYPAAAGVLAGDRRHRDYITAQLDGGGADVDDPAASAR